MTSVYMDHSSVAPVVMTSNGNKLETREISSSPVQRPSKAKGGWKAAIFIIFVEIAERFAYYGVSGNLIMYLTEVVGQPTAMAAKNVNIWHGTSSLFPLLGAFIADSYVGRFTTVVISSIIYLTGLVLLTVAAKHRREALFFASLYVLAVGESGHKPCVQTFAADQFDESLPEEKGAKSSFFNWWYLGVVVGATAAVLVVIYVQDNIGWAVGFGMLAAAVAAALVVFFIGIGTYRREAPVGSPFTRVAQVAIAAARKWRVSEIRDSRGICYEDGGEGNVGTRVCNLARTHQFRFLDNAMIVDEVDASNKVRNPWRLCSLNQVEEVKLLLRLVPVWLSCLMFAIVVAQLSTYFTKQGNTMIRTIGSHFEVPAASLQVSTGLTILISIPIYDRALVPVAKKITHHQSGLTILQRMGVGIFLSILTMVVSALVEAKRVGIAKDNGLIDAPKSIVPMSIWWLLPQYILCGLSDVFTVVGLQELFYDQMPEGMRSMGAAAYISIVGLGGFLSSAVISIVQAISSRWQDEWLTDNLNRAHLDYFYWLLVVLSAVNLCIYIWVARGFVYKKVECDDPGEGGKELGLRGC